MTWLLALLIVVLILFDAYLIALWMDERAQRKALTLRVLELEIRVFEEARRG